MADVPLILYSLDTIPITMYSNNSPSLFQHTQPPRLIVHLPLSRTLVIRGTVFTPFAAAAAANSALRRSGLPNWRGGKQNHVERAPTMLCPALAQLGDGDSSLNR